MVFDGTGRYRQEIIQELHRVFLTPNPARGEWAAAETLFQFYGQMQYHLGWLDQQFRPANGHPGKLLRPTLLLLSYELAWAEEHLSSIPAATFSPRPALPAAAAIELAHNFTLLHDDIEDGDVERRHRPTVWSVWGIPRAILVGDALIALARLALWKVLDEGVAPATALNLGKLLDAALLKLTEGQHLDLSFEQQQQVTLSSYAGMISRKTATLMRCAAEMGAVLGTSNQMMIEGLARFAHALGLAFQVRDDMLGVWASAAESGKLPAGDIFRRKKSLPILHAHRYARPADQQALGSIYTQDVPIAEAQAQEVLAIFERTHTRAYCQRILALYCGRALALVAAPGHASARTNLEEMIGFVEAACPHAAAELLASGAPP